MASEPQQLEPQQLENQIALTREQLRRDVDALVDRVSPSKVAQRQVDRIQPAVLELRTRVIERPVTVGVVVGVLVSVAVAAAVLLRRRSF